MYVAEVGVSHIRASHKQVSNLKLQVSSKSQVTVVKSSKSSQVIAITQASQVKSLLRSSKSQEVTSQNSDLPVCSFKSVNRQSGQEKVEFYFQHQKH